MNQIYDTYTQDPDETFKMYVERLMKARPRFGGTFATPPQQGQDATSKATGGLLTGLFPEYADRMGGGGGDSYMAPSGGEFTPRLRGNGPSGLTSADVDRARNIADFFAGPGQLARAAGPVGMLIAGAGTGLSKMYYNKTEKDYFNDLQGRIGATPLTSSGGYDYAAAGVNPAFGASNPYYGDFGYDGPASGPSFSPTAPDYSSLSPESVAQSLAEAGYSDTGGYSDNSGGFSDNSFGGGGGDYGSFSDGAAADAAGGYGGYW